MTKHTPGPWTASVYGDSVWLTQNGKPLRPSVCVLNGDFATCANAALIAAAPDLLAALRLWLAWSDDAHPDHSDVIAMFAETFAANEEQPSNARVVEMLHENARAAIAKAEGGQ